MDKATTWTKTEWPQLAAGTEEQFRRIGEANVRLMQGMLSVWQHEVQLGQELMAESLPDPEAIGRMWASPGAGGADWAAAHARFDRTMAAMRKITDEFCECLFDVAAVASGANDGGSRAETHRERRAG